MAKSLSPLFGRASPLGPRVANKPSNRGGKIATERRVFEGKTLHDLFELVGVLGPDQRARPFEQSVLQLVA